MKMLEDEMWFLIPELILLMPKHRCHYGYLLRILSRELPRRKPNSEKRPKLARFHKIKLGKGDLVDIY